MASQLSSTLPLDPSVSRKSAPSREIRRRHPSLRRSTTKASVSPLRPKQARQPSDANTKKEDICTVHLQRREKDIKAKIAKSTDDPLSINALDRIQQHKSLIAELRPARRKIKWNQHLSDWERKPLHRQKIEDLQIGDLQGLHIKPSTESCTPNQSEQAQSGTHCKTFAPLDLFEDVLQNPGNHVDEIEESMEKCFKTIRRVKRETEVNERRCCELRQACAERRKELMELPLPPRQQAMRQEQQQLELTKKHLQVKQAELDEQIGMLRMQFNRLAADIAMAREILEDDDRKQALEILHASFCGVENSETSSHDALDVEQEERPAASKSNELGAPSKHAFAWAECELDIKQRKPATPAAA